MIPLKNYSFQQSRDYYYYMIAIIFITIIFIIFIPWLLLFFLTKLRVNLVDGT